MIMVQEEEDDVNKRMSVISVHSYLGLRRGLTYSVTITYINSLTHHAPDKQKTIDDATTNTTLNAHHDHGRIWCVCVCVLNKILCC